MKKTLHLIIISIALHLPLYAQNISNEEYLEIENKTSVLFDILRQANDNMQAEHFQDALNAYSIIADSTKQKRIKFEKQVWFFSQIRMASCYYQLGQNEKGYKLCEQLLKEQLSDDDIILVQDRLVANGVCWAIDMMLNRQYAKARELLKEMRPLAKGEFKQSILRYLPRSWYMEGAEYELKQKYDEALSCMNKARAGFQEQNNREEEIDPIFHIGSIKRQQGDFRASTEMFQLARRYALELGKEDVAFSGLKEQYEIYQSLGDIETSTSLLLQIDSMVCSTTNKKLIYEYNEFKGNEAKKQKQYRLAEQWFMKNQPYVIPQGEESYMNGNFKESYELELDGVNKSRMYSFFFNFYSLYLDEEDYTSALKYAKKMLDIAKLDKNSYETQYLNIAYTYGRMRDSVNCFHYIDSVFLSSSKLEEPKETSRFYHERAHIHSGFKRFDLALKDFEKADSILATKYDENDIDRISLLSLTGGCEYKLNNYDRATRLLTTYVDKCKSLYGEYSSQYVHALTYLAKVKGYGGHAQEGCKSFNTAASLMRKQIKRQIPFLVKSEREQFWNQYSNLLNDMVPFALETRETQTEFTEMCYDNLIMTKSFLLETERSTYDIIKKEGATSNLHDYIVIANLNREMKEMMRNTVVNVDSITALSSQIESLERDLTKKCRSFGSITSFIDISYKNIKKALNKDEVLIDFTDFMPESGSRVYAAYLIEKNQSYPILQKLFAESTIDSLGVTRPTQYYDKVIGFEMTKLIWNPFKNHVKEGATVYYVPSQLLFQIALESLPLEDGTLLGDHYRFVRLSSSRAILNVQSHLPKDMAHHNDAILYGGLKYDMSLDEMNVESKQYNISSLLATRGDIARGDSIFRDLPQTKIEIDEIGKILRSGGMSVCLFKGTKGTEESFWSMHNKSPRILHIATHGFYYTPDEAQKNNYLRGYTDAMLLSGIILSGGNAVWLGKDLPNGALGGVLTADDIARIDLSNTELVVLSACQTGQGKATREGLFGLQRAFKKAGVNTIVMSLWNISDVVTKEFMVKFYENLVKNGWDKQNAFIDAKDYIRTKPGYDDPYYWAGFVMLD